MLSQEIVGKEFERDGQKRLLPAAGNCIEIIPSKETGLTVRAPMGPRRQNGSWIKQRIKQHQFYAVPMKVMFG